MDFVKIAQEKAKLIDKEIEKAFPKNSDMDNLYDAVWYHLGTGGKRVRPVLAIVTCEALGGNIKKVLPYAASCEILHNWLLVHDDIEDGDKVRRDQPAVWVKYGLAHGINIGDVMSQKVFEMILSSKKVGVDNETIFRLIAIMAQTAVRTAEGQTMDMTLRNNDNPSEEQYMQMITGKTAYYLTAPMTGGAIVAGANDKIVQKIIEYGKYVGPVFQITDDILDLTEGKGRGEIGCDIKEGKKSILVVHCLSKCNSAEKRKLLNILNKPKDETTDKDVFDAKKLFEKKGSLDYAQKKAKKLSEESKKVIKDLPPKLREVLEAFSDFLLERKK